MSIDRTAYNALVDDNGTNTTGSQWNKAAIAAVILDPADAAFTGASQTTTATGNQDNFAPSSGDRVVIRCTGAAPVFRGFSGGASVRTVILECLGTTLKVAHEDTNSSAANRIICESTQGQIVGVGGRIQLIYDATTSRWRASVLGAGAWIAVAHAGGNFTASGSMIWTVASGDQIAYRYRQSGPELRLIVQLEQTTVSGTPATYLQITLPFTCAFTSSAFIMHPALARDNGTLENLQVMTTAASATLKLVRPGGSNWSAATDTTAIAINTMLEIQ